MYSINLFLKVLPPQQAVYEKACYDKGTTLVNN